MTRGFRQRKLISACEIIQPRLRVHRGATRRQRSLRTGRSRTLPAKRRSSRSPCSRPAGCRGTRLESCRSGRRSDGSGRRHRLRHANAPGPLGGGAAPGGAAPARGMAHGQAAQRHDWPRAGGGYGGVNRNGRQARPRAPDFRNGVCRRRPGRVSALLLSRAVAERHRIDAHAGLARDEPGLRGSRPVVAPRCHRAGSGASGSRLCHLRGEPPPCAAPGVGERPRRTPHEHPGERVAGARARRMADRRGDRAVRRVFPR